MRNVIITDTTLRDGMHAVSHQFTPGQMAAVARGLDEAGVPIIEIGHGDGLGGASLQYGFAAGTDREYLEAVSAVLKNASLAVLLLPGIGTKVDLEMAADLGARAVRIATHVTEADISEQHIGLAKRLGMMTVGFLMMSHMASPEKILEQARLMESYGADVVYVTDSAGALLPDGVRERVGLLKAHLKVPVGFHAHNNLSLAVGNNLAAMEAGATYLDGTLRGLGGGAGNAPTEAMVAVLDRMGVATGIDLYTLMDVAENVLQPLMHRPQQISNASLMLGYAGVYSSFLLHTYRAAEKFGVDPRDILVELGRRKIVGGQEDIIIDVAQELSSERSAGRAG
ncbi:MAG: 4-hydroxy-2-oxovalerate aldolase [Firmicutes bacterium]|jgi:4-hydroxy 2-oxovalerate aldolase|nr:4-hydroxy-2-oxovalerate aldolase [Bacillota bacterium]